MIASVGVPKKSHGLDQGNLNGVCEVVYLFQAQEIYIDVDVGRFKGDDPFLVEGLGHKISTMIFWSFQTFAIYP